MLNNIITNKQKKKNTFNIINYKIYKKKKNTELYELTPLVELYHQFIVAKLAIFINHYLLVIIKLFIYLLIVIY